MHSFQGIRILDLSPPALGLHTTEILRELLGDGGAQGDALRRQGVL